VVVLDTVLTVVAVLLVVEVTVALDVLEVVDVVLTQAARVDVVPDVSVDVVVVLPELWVVTVVVAVQTTLPWLWPHAFPGSLGPPEPPPWALTSPTPRSATLKVAVTR
jgi:hypothetical protein